MNQIIITKFKKISKKKNFIIVFIISVISILFFVSIFFYNYIRLKNEESFSETTSNKQKFYRFLSNSYNEAMYQENDILGYISIPKIQVFYPFFYGYNDNLLKTLPCRFYGEMPPTKSNLCITAHNYNDTRFFGKISELNYNDKIIIENNFKNKFEYSVYDKYEVDENDLSPLNYTNKNNYILTLITCNNINKKRMIIKAKQ